MPGLFFECLLHSLECILTCITSDGWTAVRYAAEHNQPACIEALVKMMADVSICSKCVCSASFCGRKIDIKLFHRIRESPLEKSMQRGHTECIAVLDAANSFHHASAVEAHQTSGTVTFTRHRGGGYVTSDYMLHFHGFNTFVADVMLCFGCFYFEVQVFDVAKFINPQFGYCTQGFASRQDPLGEGVGDDVWSWAVDGVRQLKWHEGVKVAYDSAWAAGDIIGFALDMRAAGAAVISVSVNGSFAAPNGPVFTAIDASYLSPAFTGYGCHRVNFGDRQFLHAPPDAEYVSVHEFNKQQRRPQQQP